MDELLANKAKVEKLKTFVCSVCGYTIVAEEAPKECCQNNGFLTFFLLFSFLPHTFVELLHQKARKYLSSQAPKECPKCREMMNISWPFDEVASKKQAEDLAEKLVDHKVKPNSFKQTEFSEKIAKYFAK